eukprot:gnl/TRDRNA2_/TRDRNA2_145866_c0_seq1.p1 gnl/TRDRNA2_/TRDRNA2_145866_c0~~gnl/TRDRNA2_/TRDRNA2_145866_c0_seq1.p1  ORF type:complete len:280 (-),score=47.45 gnl/TRDRNA2_/TRDRNA2_145866_c0_seq1:73-801(-)
MDDAAEKHRRSALGGRCQRHVSVQQRVHLAKKREEQAANLRIDDEQTMRRVDRDCAEANAQTKSCIDANITKLQGKIHRLREEVEAYEVQIAHVVATPPQRLHFDRHESLVAAELEKQNGPESARQCLRNWGGADSQCSSAAPSRGKDCDSTKDQVVTLARLKAEIAILKAKLAEYERSLDIELKCRMVNRKSLRPDETQYQPVEARLSRLVVGWREKTAAEAWANTRGESVPRLGARTRGR